MVEHHQPGCPDERLDGHRQGSDRAYPSMAMMVGCFGDDCSDSGRSARILVLGSKI